jgi:hypothetical protein
VGALPESIGNGMVEVCAIRVLEVTLEIRLEIKRIKRRPFSMAGLIQEWSADASSARAESEIKSTRGRGVRAPFPRHA